MQIRLDIRSFPSPLPPKLASQEARRLLCEMLSEIGLSLPSPLQKDEHGRPYAELLSDAPKIDFNISHAGPHIVCALAIADRHGEIPRVGVDVEIPHRHISAEKIASRFFSKNEQQYLSEHAYSESVFLDIWTKKEAYLKYTGAGLSGGMQKIDTTNPNTLSPQVSFTVYSLKSDPSARLTLCTPASAVPPKEPRIRD